MTYCLRRLLFLILFVSCLCEANTPAEILKRARSGDRIAMRQIGHRLIRGDGVPHEVSSGIGWLEKAAGEGDDVAMLMLGDIYRNGIGVSKNMRKAIRYYEEAVEAGNEVAIKRLKKYRPDPNEKSSAKRENTSRSVKRPSGSRASLNERRTRSVARSEVDGVRDSTDLADEENTIRDLAALRDNTHIGGGENHREFEAKQAKTVEQHMSAQQVASKRLAAQGIREKEYSRRAIEAATKGDVELLQLLLDAGVPLNESGSTWLLHAAAKGGQTKMVAYLISKGVKVYVTDASGQTPLHVAVAYGKPEVVEQLMKAGSNVNVADSRGYTPLHLAVSGGRADIVNRLIRAGGRVEAISREGKTPLHLAAESGSVELTLILISSGADVNHVNSAQLKTVLETAADCKHWEVYKILRQAGAKN